MIRRSKLHGLRAVFLLLAVTWVPYGAIHCLGAPAGHRDCRTSLAATHSHQHSPSAPLAATSGHKSDKSGKDASPSCCSVTSHCDAGISAAPLTVFVPALAVLPSVATNVTLPPMAAEDRATLTGIHGPPTYLRNAVLRI